MLAAALVAACQTGELAGPSPAPVAIVDSSGGDLVELTRYGNAVRELSDRQLRQQYRELALRNGVSSEATIKLSLLLGAPNAPFHDAGQATRLLRDVIQRESSGDTEHAQFARLLYNLLSERMYAVSDDEWTAAMLRQTRDRNEELTEELAQVRAALDAEREQRETLQGQLDALKALEEQLSLEDDGQ